MGSIGLLIEAEATAGECNDENNSGQIGDGHCDVACTMNTFRLQKQMVLSGREACVQEDRQENTARPVVQPCVEEGEKERNNGVRYSKRQMP